MPMHNVAKKENNMDINNIKETDVPTTAEELAAYDAKFRKQHKRT